MEAFLSTLPTYVHEYLDKYPPTDVFNLLKELICFAVLYTEDRERLKRSTHEFLEKKEKEKGKVACVPETIQEDHTRKSESNNSNVHAQVDEQLAVVVDQKKKSAMPNTFPQWWGHQETESPSQSRAKTNTIDKLSTMPVSCNKIYS
ncbi:MAG: hypothetical protein EXX96DRAFT_587296 [Benjaminiella poitrasii]|nr:MAG: hypothetical protein EXX96DRAFT_587296 [Benjaminiella poitrasii]